MYKKTITDYERDLTNMRSDNYDMEIQTESDFQQGKYFLDKYAILCYKATQIIKVLDSYSHSQTYEYYELSNAYKEALKAIYFELIETRKHLSDFINIDSIEDEIYKLIRI